MKHSIGARIRVYLFDDLLADKRAVLNDLMQFLGIDKGVPLGLEKKNESSGVRLKRSKALQTLVMEKNLIKQAAKRLLPSSCVRTVRSILMRANEYKPNFKPSVRRRLVEAFRQDISNLETLIDRDLSSWTDT